MVTVVNNPGSSEAAESASSGWAVAVIILIVVVAGGAFVWYNMYRNAKAAPAGDSTNINVTLPPATNNNQTPQ